MIEKKIGEHDFRQQIGEPIPTLKKLTAFTAIADNNVRITQEFFIRNSIYTLDFERCLSMMSKKKSSVFNVE